MKWRDQWQLSFRNIFSAPVRSLLTVLGMSIGIGAILAVLTLGTAGRNQVRAEMTRLGIDRVWLTAARQEEPLMRGDGALLKRELKVAAAEQLTVPVKIAVGDKESETLLVGCDLVCLQMAGSAVTLGKMIPVQEWKQGGNGILLGETLAAELGGGPGTLVSAGGMLFRCAGVLRMEDRASGLDWNRAAFVPLETLSDSVGSSLSQITLLTDDRLTPDELARNATRVLKRSRGVEAETLTLQVQSEAAESVIAVFVEVLQWVAFICTLVGGIGVMNILLVSVRERRREIGVMMALGTEPGQVCRLFLMEALIYAAVSGVLGILTGVFLIQAAAGSIGLHPVLMAGDCAAVFACALAVGLISGVGPASRAARLKPADALRNEGKNMAIISPTCTS